MDGLAGVPGGTWEPTVHIHFHSLGWRPSAADRQGQAAVPCVGWQNEVAFTDCGVMFDVV